MKSDAHGIRVRRKGVIVIRSPLASAFRDQDFRPVKE
jgi:hypothetical protein